LIEQPFHPFDVLREYSTVHLSCGGGGNHGERVLRRLPVLFEPGCQLGHDLREEFAFHDQGFEVLLFHGGLL
jgi:hypothetical protein